MINQFLRDPLANSIAVATLLFMLVSVVYVTIRYINGDAARAKPWPAWVIPALAVAGLGVAVYLTFVETTKTTAVCGPVGDCNSVQNSPYAKAFGIIPVGILGMLGYAAILLFWLLQLRLSGKNQNYCRLAIWGFSWFGILYSIYLTFLEPFVIGATCMWCITSAILITLIFLASTPLAILASQSDSDAAEDQ